MFANNAQGHALVIHLPIDIILHHENCGIFIKMLRINPVVQIKTSHPGKHIDKVTPPTLPVTGSYFRLDIDTDLLQTSEESPVFLPTMVYIS